MQCLIAVALLKVALVPPSPQAAGSVPKASDITLELLPDIHDRAYKVDPYIAAAAALQAAGEEEAGRVLRSLCKQPDGRAGDRGQVIVLCRMLYAAKPGQEFRRPLLGAPAFLGPTGEKEWPLEPVELVDGVPFLVVSGYTLAGKPETPEHYLDYCRASCGWRAERFTPKDAEAKRKALARVLASPKWGRPLKDPGREFLTSQIE